jgi:hypothetical protein
MGDQHLSLPEDAKQIKNFSNYYITPDAELYSTARRSLRKMKPHYDEKVRYYRVHLVNDDGVGKSLLLHRLVALTYLEKPEGDYEVNHIDGDKLNNCLTNLEWVTRSENLKHAYSLNLMTVEGTANPRCILTEEQVVEIYSKLMAGEKNSVVASEYGIDRTTILGIKKKLSWNYLLKDLPDIKIKHKSQHLTTEQVVEVCVELSKGKQPLALSKELGYSYYAICDIKRRKCFTEISKEYFW